MRSFIASAVLALAALPSVLGAPAPQDASRKGGIQPPFKLGNCSVSALPPIPSGAAIAVSSGLKTHFVGFGVGTQNYTCGADGKFASAGAVAKLYDVSCFVDKPVFKTLTNEAQTAKFDFESLAVKLSPVLGGFLPLLGDHYFITNAEGKIAPKFDFTATQKKSTFVVAAKKAGMPSPGGNVNVDWLQLTKVDGNMGTEVFRVDTRKGQPPTSCTPGTSKPTQIPYGAMYWFMDA